MIETAMLCLALNIYHEARSEPLEGQKAVAQVTLTRAGHDPAKVCSTVFRRKQFSWANPLTTVSPGVRKQRAHRFFPHETEAWEQAKHVAARALNGEMRNVVGYATHYHADYVSPHWTSSMRKIKRIGRHIFYVDHKMLRVVQRQ